ncbi:MAG: penicillin acylase family protein [Candidatus Longimicrobiales bacterium M2_2A_002]
MRKFVVGVLAVILLIAVAALAGLAWVRSADQGRDGTEVVPGIGDRVEVYWSDEAVPHVFAGSLDDAAFAQGFLHARDRLWQMELVRRAVQGRLAEVMGEHALSTDRFMRRIGLWEAARTGVRELGPRETAVLQAYADGVNAAVERWSGPLPPEFLVLGFEPEPWQPVHTLAVAKMMSLTLAMYGQSVSVARALRRLPEDRVRWLFPGFPDWDATILPPEPPETPPLAAALIDRYSVAAASNSWVVDGSRTASGRPIVANDMHLELQAPSLWYLMGLHAPATDTLQALDVTGVTIPGAPLVIVGRNRAMAWGMTNAYVDDVDLFIERVDPDDPGRYLTPGGSRPFEVVAESIAVKGRESPDVLEVRRTRHGPVLPLGDTTASGDTVLAVRWTAHDPSTVIRAILGLNLASDWSEFLEAADLMDDPHQNLVYGDTAGHIGYVMGGTVPIRGDRRPAPVIPRPGWTGEWDWTGELPFDEHPRAFDPPAGYLVTANNRQTAEPVSRLISATWLQPFRAMRITEMITESGRALDADSVLAMQLDVHDLYAERYVDRAIAAAGAAGLDNVADRLRAWDGDAAPDSRAAPLFYAWNEILRRDLARDLYGGEPSYFTRESATVVIEGQAVPWAADPEARYRELAERAIRETADVAAGRTWAESNHAVHSHALGGVDVLDRILGLDVGPLPHEGSPFTVNVAHWAFRSPDDDFPFLTTAGVSMRQVADLGNTDAAAGFVIPTGQSGLPFSEHYRDQTPLWRNGGLLMLSLDRDAAEASAAETLILDPEVRDD